MSFLRSTILQTCNQNPFCSMFNSILNIKNWFISSDDFNLYDEVIPENTRTKHNKMLRKTSKKSKVKEHSYGGQFKEKLISLRGLEDLEISDYYGSPGCVHILQLDVEDESLEKMEKD